MEYNPLDDLFNTIPLIIIPDKTQLEFECRFSIDERRPEKRTPNRFSPTDSVQLAKNIINHYNKKKNLCSLEQSINFIKNTTDSSNNIKQLIFVNGVQDKNKQSHYTKEKLINNITVLDIPSYKIVLSFEKQINEFSVKECSAARIKLRFSINIQDNWRLDITLVKNIESLSNPRELKNAKSAMLYELSVDNFIENAPWDVASYVEYELEYIQLDKSKQLDIKSLNSAVGEFHKHIDSLKTISEVNTTNIDSNRISRSINSDYQKKIHQIATYTQPPKRVNLFLHKYGIKQLSNQVIEMDKNMFLSEVLPNIKNYDITDKVDGIRTILYLSEDGVYGINNQLEILDKTGLQHTYIFDTEKYMPNTNNLNTNNLNASSNTAVYYIFDVLVWESISIVDQPFEQRKTYFSKAVELVQNGLNLDLREKPFERLTDNFQQQIKTLKAVEKPYETDGFIFTPINGLYNTMQVYKYKPLEKLTVDFLIKKCPKKLLGIKPYIENNNSLYLLFCGIRKTVYEKLKMQVIDRYDNVFPHINTYHLPEYFPIQFEPSNLRFAYLFWSDNTDLDDNIGEFRICNWEDDHTNYKWELLKIRDDRKIEVARGNYFGNNYKIAELTWMSYQNPLIIEDLSLDELTNVYFQKHESKLHDASRSYNSYVKTKIFDQYDNTDTVMDIASGKGQDLFRYAKSRIGKVLFLEIDGTALLELIRRKHDYSTNRSYHNKMSILTQQMDLNEPYQTNINRLNKTNLIIPNNGFNLIVCNFAMHYLVSGKSAVINIGRFISHYLKPGGRFIFTSFDGERVFNLLEENKGEWKSEIKNKFHIKKKYKNKIFQPVGQQIDVLLPFSNGTYYTEYLININYISAEFEKFGLILETNQSFEEYQASYSGQRNKKNPNKIMDSDDLLYTSLYNYYGFYKTAKKSR